jgi:hypothetical protein
MVDFDSFVRYERKLPVANELQIATSKLNEAIAALTDRRMLLFHFLGTLLKCVARIYLSVRTCSI